MIAEELFKHERFQTAIPFYKLAVEQARIGCSITSAMEPSLSGASATKKRAQYMNKL